MHKLSEGPTYGPGAALLHLLGREHARGAVHHHEAHAAVGPPNLQPDCRPRSAKRGADAGVELAEGGPLVFLSGQDEQRICVALHVFRRAATDDDHGAELVPLVIRSKQDGWRQEIGVGISAFVAVTWRGRSDVARHALGQYLGPVSKELHAIPAIKAERRKSLLDLLGRFLPVRPTRIPILGLARLGAAVIATPHATALRAELKRMGFRKLDAAHLINAHLARCQVFVTNDKEDMLREGRKEALERLLGLQILTPAEVLDLPAVSA